MQASGDDVYSENYNICSMKIQAILGRNIPTPWHGEGNEGGLGLDDEIEGLIGRQVFMGATAALR